MSRKSNRRTEDFAGMKYSPELIRQLENPEYARQAEAYELEARNRKHSSYHEDDLKYDYNSDYSYDYDYDYAEAAEDPASIRRNARNKKQKQNKKKNEKKSRNIKWKKILRRLLIVLAIFVVGVCALVWSLTDTFDRQKTNPDDFAISEKAAKELKGYRNIAILGTDSRADESYDVSRTDAIIVLSFKKSSGDLRMISVMRDSYLKFEYFDGELIYDKVTHANVYGGAVNTCAALNRGLDLNIDEYIMFNWKAVSDAVDALGGITINVKENEIGDLNHWGPETAENVGGTFTPIEKTGKQTLDGVQATTYCRIRKNSGGDSSRTTRYKKVVTATMKKALTQPWKLQELSDNVFPNIRTNMTQVDILTLLPLAARMDMQPSISWPKEYYAGLLSDGISYVVPITLESEVKRLHKKAFKQEDYQLSDEAASMNDDIIWSTGIQ